MSLAVTVFLGLTEGVGLLLLVPLLQLIGFDGAAKSDAFSLLTRRLFERIGLPLSLPAILCAYMAVVSAYAVARRYQAVLDARMVHGYTRFMQDRFYQAFARVDWLGFVRIGGADVVRVLTGDLLQMGAVAQQFMQLIATAVIAIVYVAVSLSVSPVMTLFTLACAAMLLAALQPQNRKALQLGEALQAAVKDMYTAVSEHLGGMKIAKGYGLEQRHVKDFLAITTRIAARRTSFTQATATTRMQHQLGITVAIGVFFYLAATFLPVPATSLLLMVFVFARLLPRVSGIQNHIQQIGNALPAYQAAMLLQQRLEAACEPPAPALVRPLRLNVAVDFRRVSFSYSGSRGDCVLRDIDLVIPARTTIAIAGPSGSGKTTLADLLTGLLTPTEGAIFIDNKKLTREWVHDWRGSIGYVPQETFLFHNTIRANLLWVKPDAEEEELWEAIRLSAADFVADLPEGLDTVLGDRGVRLSGGERQRIALARALLRKPTLLILDEATSSLDTENEQRIQDAIEGLRGGLTMVVIAHRLSAIRKADRIVVLE